MSSIRAVVEAATAEARAAGEREGIFEGAVLDALPALEAAEDHTREGPDWAEPRNHDGPHAWTAWSLEGDRLQRKCLRALCGLVDTSPVGVGS